ncbi:MAG: hypothetical protein M3Q69_01990 [Acidobacteriota bacterium]|nr:hypothetical protein [Acidobacteriota bacterium]
MKKLVLVVLVLASTSLFAQGRASAKFVCGKADQPVVDAFAFAPGAYYTSINVTNPNGVEIQGRKNFSVALLSQKAGPVSPWVGWALKPWESMQVDCGDIYAHLNIPVGTFIDGFVHFVSDQPYDLTGVYTVTDGARIVSQDVEEITIK